MHSDQRAPSMQQLTLVIILNERADFFFKIRRARPKVRCVDFRAIQIHSLLSHTASSSVARSVQNQPQHVAFSNPTFLQ